MLNKLERFLREREMVRPGDTVIAAVSGGGPRYVKPLGRGGAGFVENGHFAAELVLHPGGEGDILFRQQTAVVIGEKAGGGTGLGEGVTVCLEQE